MAVSGAAHSADAYRDQLVGLLPPGRAWSRDPEGVLARLLGAYADEFARVDSRMGDLLDEADPRATLELLVDWERVAALPDACAGAPDTISERRIALANKVAQLGGQSVPYMIAIAARLGYDVDIVEFTSCDAGFGCGSDLNGDAWRHAWRVDVFLGSGALTESLAEFCAGSEAGDLLLGYGALDLECLLRRARPAHTEIIIAYHIEPEPGFWFDFTQEA